MKIDRKLNLVIPLERDEGEIIYVFSTPIRRETFEFYNLPMSKAFASIYTNGLSVIAGPRVAALSLREAAENTRRANSECGNWWGDDDGVEKGLMNEIRRLTNVLTADGSGWSMVPYQTALDRDLISDDEAAEVEGAICFFTLISAIQKRKAALPILSAAADLWDLALTSSTLTEYKAGLKISTPAETSEPKAKQSSIPR